MDFVEDCWHKTNFAILIHIHFLIFEQNLLMILTHAVGAPVAGKCDMYLSLAHGRRVVAFHAAHLAEGPHLLVKILFLICHFRCAMLNQAISALLFLDEI